MSRQRSSDLTTGVVANETIHIRNYDVETSHSVWINVVDDGERAFETTRRLRPGEACSIGGAVAPGEYDIEVGVDGLRREATRCHVGAAPELTALVEVGNGVVSVTEGTH